MHTLFCIIPLAIIIHERKLLRDQAEGGEVGY